MGDILIEIKNILDKKDWPCILKEPSAEIPYRCLLLDCGTNEEDQKELLEITTQFQSFPSSFMKDEERIDYELLQFQFVLPLIVYPDTFQQVSNALHFFNRLLHCPGFEMDELSDRVIYRYVLFLKKENVDASFLLHVLGNIQLCFKMFSPYVKEIAEGKYTLEDILAQIGQIPNTP